MLSVSKNGIIQVSRGDSFVLNTKINLGTELLPIYYQLGENDTLYFAVMEANHPFEHAIVRKTYTEADQDEDLNVAVTFVPEDTEFLVPGDYYYMVKLRKFVGQDPLLDESYEVSTIISKTKFIIID